MSHRLQTQGDKRELPETLFNEPTSETPAESQDTLRCPFCGSENAIEQDDALSLYRAYECGDCEALYSRDEGFYK